MTYKHFQRLVDRDNELSRWKSGIGVFPLKNVGGTEHPLWTALNVYIPPPIDWKHVKGHERQQIRRAGDALDKAGFPYIFYADYIRSFGKGYCKKRNPLLITALKRRKNGNLPILTEFIEIMTKLLEIHKKNPYIIDIVDTIYHRFPDSYGLGIIKYVYTVDVVGDAFKTHSPRWVWSEALAATSLSGFWDALGASVSEREAQALDLGQGQVSEHLQTLQRERRIRVGLDDGVANPMLNKYFNKSGKLNVRGLKLLQEE